MKLQAEKRLDIIFQMGWALFCLAYYLPLLIAGNIVPTSPMWFFERQVQWIPFMNFTSNCIKMNILPAWCPHFYSGFPYMAYPPNFFPGWAYIFSSHSRLSCSIDLVGYLMGGVFFYRGLRKLGLSAYASLFGLLAFVGGGYFSIAAAYLPFTLFLCLIGLWSVAGMFGDKPRLKYFVAFFICFGFGLDCNIEQEFYLSAAIFMAAIFLGKPPRWKRVLVMLIAFGVAFLFELGPFINLAAYGPHTVRALGITLNNYLRETATIKMRDFAQELIFPLAGLLPVMLRASYIGLTVLLMALAGIKKLRIRAMPAVMISAIFLLYVINWVPVVRLLFHVPILNKMAMHSSAMIVPVLCICLLAAAGAEEFIRSRPKIFAGALLAVSLLIGVTSFKFDHVRAIGLFVAAGFGIAALTGFKKQWSWQVSLLLALIFDVSYNTFRLQPRAPASYFYDRPAVVDYLKGEKRLVRFWPLSIYSYEDTQVHPLVGMNLPVSLPGTQSPLGYWRVPVLRNARLINLITPGYLKIVDGLFDGVDLAPSRDARQIDEGDLFWLRLLNVGNFISRGAELHVKGIEPNGQAGDINFYTIPDTLSRYILATRIERFKNGEEVFKKIADKDFDPTTTALVEQEIAFLPHNSSDGKVALEKFLPGRWDFNLSLPEAASAVSTRLPQYFLVVGETYLPGWRAFSAGREFRVFRANYAFMGLALPPGHYDLKLVYWPYHARIGMFSTEATMAFWIGIGIVLLIKKYALAGWPKRGATQ
jgi:hypothetical protein